MTPTLEQTNGLDINVKIRNTRTGQEGEIPFAELVNGILDAMKRWKQ